MKFLNKNSKNKQKLTCKNYDLFLKNEVSFDYFLYEFKKPLIKNRKINNKAKKGIIKNPKRSSNILDKNTSLILKYLKTSQKKGKNFLIFKNLNKSIFNFYDYFNFNYNNNNFSKKYHNYEYLSNLILNDFKKLDLNYLISNFVLNLQSIFELKSKKNKIKDKNNNKYLYEIVYIKKENRLKYLIKSLSMNCESFKKNQIWERIFWSFFILFFDTNNSFLNKKKLFLYFKSIKFFKKTK